MPLFLLISLLILATALFPDALPAAGFTWDALNGLGLVGLMVLVTLAWDTETPAREPRLRAHQNMAVLATALVTVHVAGFLFIDPVIVEHLKPTAPAHMLLALLSYLALLAITLTSFPTLRRRLYGRFQKFKSWHFALSLITLGGALWHVIGTGSVYHNVPRALALIGIAGALPLLAVARRRNGSHTGLSRRLADQAAADLRLTGMVGLALFLALAYAGIKTWAALR